MPIHGKSVVPTFAGELIGIFKGELVMVALKQSATRFATICVLIAVPSIGGALIGYLVQLSAPVVAAGAVGWFFSLLLRPTIIYLANTSRRWCLRRVISHETAKQTKSNPQNLYLAIAVSGPIEEFVRLVVVMLCGGSVATGIAVGLGWAFAEAVFLGVTAAITSGGVIRSLFVSKSFHQSKFTYEIIEWVAVVCVERGSAFGIHVSSSVILALCPVCVLPLTVVHSVTNVGAVRLARHLWYAQVFAAAVAAALSISTWLWVKSL